MSGTQEPQIYSSNKTIRVATQGPVVMLSQHEKAGTLANTGLHEFADTLSKTDHHEIAEDTLAMRRLRFVVSTADFTELASPEYVLECLTANPLLVFDLYNVMDFVCHMDFVLGIGNNSNVESTRFGNR
ncbi:hypothetical protein CDAR_378661 [Caerostris darwini]|uniref:BRCT domain-containing protein n=1 Tax=Caerostris darwini TaxID=1538125 RepID=A0AAV4MT99_9ARAC|nr:hypothetical protein CDAR_378661 [Caerostris darwini]